jgi:hypothetical protein
MLTVPLCAIVGIVYLCASSTPLLGLILGCMAWAAWMVRDLMRPIRWAALLGLIGLHMIMTKPVWHLLARASVVGGSTGWHRYALIDRAIQHVGEWWLFGTRSTAHWGRQMFDITNQYVREGVKGGLLALILFITLMSLAYGGAGRLRKATARLRYAPRLAWGLGAAIFAHMAMFPPSRSPTRSRTCSCGCSSSPRSAASRPRRARRACARRGELRRAPRPRPGRVAPS